MFIRVDDTYLETQFSHSKLRKFVKNGPKTAYNFVEGCFSIKLTKICKGTSGEMFSTFADMPSLTSNSRLCNFTTS